MTPQIKRNSSGEKNADKDAQMAYLHFFFSAVITLYQLAQSSSLIEQEQLDAFVLVFVSREHLNSHPALPERHPRPPNADPFFRRRG